MLESTLRVQTRQRTSLKTESMRAVCHSWSTEMRVSSNVGEYLTPLRRILKSFGFPVNQAIALSPRAIALTCALCGRADETSDALLWRIRPLRPPSIQRI